ncbi:MAG: efflux RND transporter periplasmic adaptor subunit, partial [Beijerinckiaceae bacterium]
RMELIRPEASDLASNGGAGMIAAREGADAAAVAREAASGAKRGSRLRGGGFVLLIIVCLAALFFRHHQQADAFSKEANGPGSGAGAGPGGRPIPVTIGTVEAKDFPIYRIGLGTVQAYNTVTVKVRVDGEVQKIAFREGQEVEPGELLAQIDPRPFAADLQRAEADLARDQALLANAKLDLDRLIPLVARDFTTRQSVDTQSTLIDQYKAAIQHDQAVIDNARVQLGYTTITSPLRGRTGIRLIDQGNIVHATDSTGLVVIAQLNPISVVFTLPQQLLPEISGAMRRGDLTVLAYDQDNQLQLGEGKLELIDNEIDPTTGTARLKATFPNDDERLWPGEFVNAWLKVETRHGPVVAASAVQLGANGDFAFSVEPDASIKMHPLRIAGIQQGEALIETGLSLGERVVVDGHYKLRPGVHVVDAAKSGRASDGAKKSAASAGTPAP